MCTVVNCQSTLLYKAFPASWELAFIGPLIGMDPVVPLQVGLAIETLQHPVSSSPRFYFSMPLTLVQDSQSHGKGRDVDSFSIMWSRDSIVTPGG
jgi:hypothetical protein